ncbi:MAG: DUF3291 domain-containing protein [Acidimicrobiales bacterium]|jgi:hypothetical protein
MTYQLAQVNVARLRAPLESERLEGFVGALDSVNASAEAAPGFVWRLKNEEGNATSIVAFEWDVGDAAGIIVNMSVWQSVEYLWAWVNDEVHRSVLLQRRKWFETVSEATAALWWVLAGHEPTTDEAEQKLRHLRQNGPSPSVFSFRHRFEAPRTEETN